MHSDFKLGIEANQVMVIQITRKLYFTRVSLSSMP